MAEVNTRNSISLFVGPAGNTMGTADAVLNNKTDATLTRRVKLEDGKQDGNPVADRITVADWIIAGADTDGRDEMVEGRKGRERVERAEYVATGPGGGGRGPETETETGYWGHPQFSSPPPIHTQHGVRAM